MPLRANWVRDNILGVETWNTLFAGVSCMVRWRHDVILPQFQMVEPGVRWTKPENFGKTSPTEKTHLPKRDDVFFFFWVFRGSRRDLPSPSPRCLAEPKPHPGLEVNKWGVMKVAGDEMKELEVNVPRWVVGCLWWVDWMNLWRIKNHWLSLNKASY